MASGRYEPYRLQRRRSTCAAFSSSRSGLGDLRSAGQLKVHLARLASLEYVLVHRIRSGQGYAYELLYGGEGETGGAFVMGLTEPPGGGGAYDKERSGQKAVRSDPGRGAGGAQTGGGRRRKTGASPSDISLPGSDDLAAAQMHVTPVQSPALSYPHPAMEAEG